MVLETLLILGAVGALCGDKVQRDKNGRSFKWKPKYKDGPFKSEQYAEYDPKKW